MEVGGWVDDLCLFVGRRIHFSVSELILIAILLTVFSFLTVVLYLLEGEKNVGSRLCAFRPPPPPTYPIVMSHC
jgi:hypothetical protein